jgi:hypothetical protein
MSEENEMDRTVKALARKVANGTAERAELRGFKEAAGLLGWIGIRGGGVVNHYTDQRVKSWAALAAVLLEGSYGQEAETRMEEAKEAGEANAFPYPTRGLIPEVDAILDRRAQTANRVPAPAPSIRVVPAAAGRALEFSYLYATRVPTVPLTDGTAVEVTLTERILGVTEGLCESGAALECSLEHPNMAIYRVLPESMLPGQEPTRMFQCLPCYEASAEAYVRKLHHIHGAS